MTARSERRSLDTPRPLYSEDAEFAVLGAALMDEAALTSARKVVSESDFYRAAHRRIFAACTALADAGAPVEPVTVCEHLERSGELEAVGGREFIGYLLDAGGSTSGVEYHAKIISARARDRRFVGVLDDLARVVASGMADAETAARDLAQQLVGFAVTDGESGFRAVTSDELYRYMEQLEENAREVRNGTPLGVLTGLHALDAKIHGFRSGELVVPGAGPKVGKSVLTWQVIRHNVFDAQRVVGVVSAEMTRQECLDLVFAAESKVPREQLRASRFSGADFQRLAKTAGEFGTAVNAGGLYIDDVAFPELGAVVARIQALKVERPTLSFVAVDYLQLVTSREKGRRGDEELATVCQALKAIAKRCELVIWAPAQLNYKETDKRANGEPAFHDFQGGSAMAQAANFPLLLWRPHLHSPSGHANELAVLAPRTRGAGPFRARLWWDGVHGRVEDWPLGEAML